MMERSGGLCSIRRRCISVLGIGVQAYWLGVHIYLGERGQQYNGTAKAFTDASGATSIRVEFQTSLHRRTAIYEKLRMVKVLAERRYSRV